MLETPFPLDFFVLHGKNLTLRAIQPKAITCVDWFFPCYFHDHREIHVLFIFIPEGELVVKSLAVVGGSYSTSMIIITRVNNWKGGI